MKCSAILRISWRYVGKWCPCSRLIRRSRSGSLVAAPAKRSIRWRFCCAKKGCWIAPFSMPPTSTRARWIKPGRGFFSLENVRAYTHNYQQAGGQRSFADYYTAAYGYAIFDKSLCDNVTFADHSLATDSVFSETQLISCRNVLIYFNKKTTGSCIWLVSRISVSSGLSGTGQ